MTSGRRYSISRLRPYTYTETRCRICDRRIESDKLNPHFAHAHPEIYYLAYPGRRRRVMVSEVKEASE